MSSIAIVFARAILNGYKTLEDCPKRIRADVEKALEKLKAE